MRDLISHLNGDGVIAVADIQSSDEVNTNATEAAISATGKVKGALGGEDRNQTQLVLTEGAQESSPASAVLPRNSLSAVSTGDGEEAKPNAPSDQRPIENNITDSTVEIRPQTSDGNVSIQNAIEAGAAQNSTSSNSSLLDVEASEESKNSLGVSHGIGTTLGTRAEEAVSKEHSPRHVPNGTNSASVAQSLTVPAGSVPSSISVSADPVAIAAVIPSSVESNGTEPVLSMTEVADSLSGRAADSGKSATNTSSDAAETVAENSETSKENTTIAIPKTEITPKSAQSTVTPISAVDNSSSPVRAENVSTKLTDLLPTSAETRVDTCNTTKTVADESVTVSDAAHKTRTASGELEILNTTVAPTNATACRSVTDRDKHALLSGNITEKDAGSVNSTVPDAVTDLALSRVSAHEAVPRGTNGTSSSSSNARETSKEPNPLLKENTATNATGTSDLNSTVSNAEIAVTADSALGPVVERETDNETRARPDMIRKESGHADALGDVSDVSKLAALPHVLLAAASEKYETLLAGGEDKEREWDKDDKISSLEAASLSGYGTLAHGSQGSTPGMLSPLAAAPLAAALLDSPVLPLLTTPGLPRGMNGPTVGFSPLCLETLRFTEFQAMMANKLKQRAESDKTQLPLHSQDNVFRQLMMKIKTLEMNYAIIEMYSAQVSCFLLLLFRHPHHQCRQPIDM